MAEEMIWTTEGGVSLRVERLEKSAVFKIQKGKEVIARGEIEDWKFIRIVKLLEGVGEPRGVGKPTIAELEGMIDSVELLPDGTVRMKGPLVDEVRREAQMEMIAAIEEYDPRSVKMSMADYLVTKCMPERTLPCVNSEGCHYNDETYPLSCSKETHEFRCCTGYKAEKKDE